MTNTGKYLITIKMFLNLLYFLFIELAIIYPKRNFDFKSNLISSHVTEYLYSNSIIPRAEAVKNGALVYI